MSRQRLITTALLMSLPVIAARADDGARLIEFDPPGAATTTSPACGSACGTQALANNDAGDVVGVYTDANVVPHGFVRTHDGQISSFDAPGAGLGAGLDEGTVPVAINDRGVIAGQFEDPSLVFHAFIRSPDGGVEIFEAPDAGSGPGQGTLAYSLNIEGDTAGIYFDANGEHAFVRTRHGALSEFDPPGSIFTMLCEETCLNEDGSATGFYADANLTVHGFVRTRDGTVTSFDAPQAGQGGFAGTFAASINDEGEIGGYVVDANNVAHGFIRHRDGSFGADFDVPGAFNGSFGGTAAFSINAAGATTGDYSDASLANHGYARSAGGHFRLFDAPDGGSGAFQGTRPSTNNRQGQVAGWYVDANGLNHGFVWLPSEDD